MTNELSLEPFLTPFHGVAETVREIAEPLIVDEGCELVMFQLVKGNRKTTVRFFVDRAGAELDGGDEAKRIGLAELETLNRRLSDVLDVEDNERGLFRGAYVLEVSSPGVDRPLTKRSHYLAAAGKRVRIKTLRSVSGSKNHDGVLLGLEKDTVSVEVKAGAAVKIPVDAIATANIVFDFGMPKKGKRKKSKRAAAR